MPDVNKPDGVLRGDSGGEAYRGAVPQGAIVRPAGFEPATSGLGNRCSILLSYGRAVVIFLHNNCFSRLRRCFLRLESLPCLREYVEQNPWWSAGGGSVCRQFFLWKCRVVNGLLSVGAGFGTCGTITGVGRYLKEKKSSVKIVGIEPATAEHKLPGMKRISDLRADLLPKIPDKSVVDDIVSVEDDDAYETAIRLAREDGILAGPTTGAVLHVALRYARTQGPGDSDFSG